MEQITGITFNVLILDCEGCHRDFINTYKHKIATGVVNKIIFGNTIYDPPVNKSDKFNIYRGGWLPRRN